MLCSQTDPYTSTWLHKPEVQRDTSDPRVRVFLSRLTLCTVSLVNYSRAPLLTRTQKVSLPQILLDVVNFVSAFDTIYMYVCVILVYIYCGECQFNSFVLFRLGSSEIHGPTTKTVREVAPRVVIRCKGPGVFRLIRYCIDSSLFFQFSISLVHAYHSISLSLSS